MNGVTLKNLRAHKLRLLLTAVSVMLGVAFVAGTLVLTDTMSATFDKLFGEASRNTSVVVRAESAFSTGDGGDEREGVPLSLVDRVERVPGVDHAEAYVEGFAQLLGRDGTVLGNGQAPNLGVSWTESAVLSPLRTEQGRGPRGAGEIAVDVDTAAEGGLAVGDRTRVLLRGPAQDVEVVGIFRFGDSNALAGATMTAFDTTTAQALLTDRGTVTRVDVRAEDGVGQAELARRIAASLPDGVEAVTGEQAAAEAADGIQESLSFFTYFLLTFAIIAVFVGSFIIFNTFSMLVAQRTRELGLLRAVGATRGQVTRSVLVEALVVGLLGSVVGLGSGVGVAIGLQRLLNATGAGLPAGDLAIEPRTIVWSFAVGVGVTTVAAVLPARRAAKIPPVAALRDDPRMPAGSLRKRLVAGSLLSLAGCGSLAAGLSGVGDPPVALVALGILAVFLGVTTLAPFISRPLVRLLALPLPRLFGAAGRLSRENALRNPRRTSATAAALMIGLALVATFSVMGSSLKASFGKAIDESLGADAVLGTENYMPISTDVAARVARVPGVQEVGSIRWGVAKFGADDGRDWLAAVPPHTLNRLMTVDMVAGEASALGEGKLLVAENIARSNGWTVGQTIPAEYAATGKATITVGGVYRTNPLAGDILISTDVYDANFSEELDSGVMLAFADGVDRAAVVAAVQRELEAFPNVRLLDQSEFKADQQGFVDTILGLVTALLALAVLIAMFGIVNTLALAVFERTREIGLLRAVGMSRRQLRRTIRLEAVIIAVFGAVLGIALGTAFGWAIVRSLREFGVSELDLPVGRLAIAVVLAGLVGVLAAVWPARRAAKMDVLGAIATT